MSAIDHFADFPAHGPGKLFARGEVQDGCLVVHVVNPIYREAQCTVEINEHQLREALKQIRAKRPKRRRKP